MLASLHGADWDAKQQDKLPTLIARATWIIDHDCQKSTYEEFNKAAECITTNTKYVPANIPADGAFGIVDSAEAKSTTKVPPAAHGALPVQ